MMMIVVDMLVVGKIKYKTTICAIEELVGLNPKMYSFLVDDGSELKIAKCVNKTNNKSKWIPRCFVE